MCKHCEHGHYPIKSSNQHGSGTVQVTSNNQLSVEVPPKEYCDGYSDTYYFDAKYCPFCGRELNSTKKDDPSYLIINRSEEVLGCYETVEKAYDAIATELFDEMLDEDTYYMYTVTAYKELNVELEHKIKIK